VAVEPSLQPHGGRTPLDHAVGVDPVHGVSNRVKIFVTSVRK
jgi:hypothetical protein